MSDRQPSHYARGGQKQEYTDISGYSSGQEDRSINSYSGARPEPPPLSPREERSQRRRRNKEHRRRNRQKGKRNRRIFKLVWFVMVIFLGLATAQLLLMGMDDMLAIGRQSLSVTV